MARVLQWLNQSSQINQKKHFGHNQDHLKLLKKQPATLFRDEEGVAKKSWSSVFTTWFSYENIEEDELLLVLKNKIVSYSIYTFSTVDICSETQPSIPWSTA